MKTNELIDEVVSLPVEERARVVDSLLESLNPQDTEGARAWIDLARNRLAELRSGAVKPVPGDQVFARIHQRYGA